MEYFIKAPKKAYVHKLDVALLSDTPLALSVLQKTLEDLFKDLLLHINFLLGDKYKAKQANLLAMDEIEHFIDKVHIEEVNHMSWQRLIDIIHSFDHLQRLYDRCEEDEGRALYLPSAKRLVFLKEMQKELNLMIVEMLEIKNYAEAQREVKRLKKR